MCKKILVLSLTVTLCLLVIGGSIAYASSNEKTQRAPIFKSQPKQLEVTIEKPSNEEILENNKEYIDFIKANLGIEAAREVETELLEPWANIPSEGEIITIDVVETHIIK
jgi:hypothetical protein